MGFSFILVFHTKRSYIFNIHKQTNKKKKLVKMMKIALIASVLVASALANPAGPPPPYHPAPVHGGYKIPPRPFAYAYGVSDEYSGTNFDKKETQDENGVVSGEYRVALPDGRTQIVTYHADHVNGYVADVKYEGVAKEYAPAPYHPAPVHAHAPYARQ